MCVFVCVSVCVCVYQLLMARSVLMLHAHRCETLPHTHYLHTLACQCVTELRCEA